MRGWKKWPILALSLLLAAAFLMSRGENSAAPTPRVVDFPEALRPSERQRIDARRVLPPAPATSQPATPTRPRDPLLAALGATKGKMALVLEANAIRYSPIGELLIRCLGSDAELMSKFREETGIDPLQDLDRIALTEDGVILTGNFQNARLRKLADGDPESYGNESRIYGPAFGGESSATSAPADSQFRVGTWRNQLLVFGQSRAGIAGVLDSVEGRSYGVSPIDESDTYGEVYGTVPAEALSDLLSAQQSDLARRFQSAAQRIRLHLDVTHDVALVADVDGANPSELEDLAKALGASLSVASLEARMSSQGELAEILDSARVIPQEKSFRLEVALPMKMIEKQLASCAAGSGESSSRTELR